MSSKHSEFYYVSLDEEIGRVFLQREPHPLAVSEFLLKPLAEFIVTACNEHDQLKQDRAELVEAVNHSIKMFKLIEERYPNTTTNTLFEFNNLLKKLGEL